MRVALGTIVAAFLLEAVVATAAHAQRWDGFNIIAAQEHPFGSPGARQSLAAAKAAGATAVAIVPFLWQRAPEAAHIVRGDDMSDEVLRIAIGEAQALGLAVVVKPHVWVSQSWAGAVAPQSEGAWASWFADYRGELLRIASVAQAGRADAIAIGTELAKTSHRDEWLALIADVRATFEGRVTYVAHNVEEARVVPFWDRLDAIGVSLYPALGADDDRDARRGIMQDIAGELDALSKRFGKPVLIGEVGLRSARGAAERPWESAEERLSPPDPALQADVLADWLAALQRPSISGVLVWRWFTDPDAGGVADTDFTVQGKPAEDVLRCAWLAVCAGR